MVESGEQNVVNTAAGQEQLPSIFASEIGFLDICGIISNVLMVKPMIMRNTKVETFYIFYYNIVKFFNQSSPRPHNISL